MGDALPAKIHADTKIDRFKLEEESEKNSSQMDTFSTLAGEAEYRMGQAKYKLRQAQASAELQIRRSSPKDYKLEKFTDPTVAALAEIAPEVIAAEEEFLKAQDNFSFYSGQVAALQEKSRELKNLSYLWGNGYYSSAGVRNAYPKHGQQEED